MPIKHTARVAAERLIDRAGYDLVKRNWDSPLPEPDLIPARHWTEPVATRGVDLQLDAAWRLLTDLAPVVAEFPSDFPINNGTYESVDAETLYALVRRSRPRVVELGSGTSSHVIHAAGPREHRVFDPYPWSATSLGPLADVQVQPLRSEDVPLAEFTALGAADILFVDTTHTVKTGGDVTRIVLEILPALASGVLVHFHDIFLPYDYPRHLVVEERRVWAEQYLLHAFLAFNDSFDVLLPCHALARDDPNRLAELVPSFSDGVAPGAFWIMRG